MCKLVMLTHLKGMLVFKVPHYFGHNPLGAAMFVAHVSGVLVSSFLKGENLVKTMTTGKIIAHIGRTLIQRKGRKISHE